MTRRGGPGRPRAHDQERRAGSGRDEILDAAAELFSGSGYAATSTRAIAEAVGIRQASLYYHFPSKDRILAELLAETVRPAVEYIDWLDGVRAGAPDKLWSLAYVDVHQLASSRWNVAAIYLLPEVRTGPFEEFQEGRRVLKRVYGDLVAGCLATWDPRAEDAHTLAEFVFALVEGVERIRADEPGLSLEDYAGGIASASIRMVRCPPRSFPAVERRGRALVGRYRSTVEGLGRDGEKAEPPRTATG